MKNQKTELDVAIDNAHMALDVIRGMDSFLANFAPRSGPDPSRAGDLLEDAIAKAEARRDRLSR